MRVALVIYSSTIDGGGGTERRFARAVAKIMDTYPGCEATMLMPDSLRASLNSCGALKGMPACCIMSPESCMSGVQFSKWVIDKIDGPAVDVVHLVLMQRSLWLLYGWLMLNQLPVVVTVASSQFSAYGRPRALRLIAARLLWRRATIVDSLYPSFARSQWGKDYAHKTRITPCSFTDYQVFTKTHKQKVIAFVGRLIFEKNPMMLLDAIEKIRDEHPDVLDGWRIRIAGKGHLSSSIRERVGLKNLGFVELLDTGPRIDLVLGESLIFVSIQRTENYPSQSLLEAMACENAIIATDVGDTRLLLDDTCALLIEPSATALAQALLLLLSDKNRVTYLATNARRRVLETQSLARFADYLREIWSAASSLPSPG